MAVDPTEVEQQEGGAPVTPLTAFRVRDRIFKATCAKVPRFRFKPAKKDDEEDLYLLDLFFLIAVTPDDMVDSDHASHAFRPSAMAALNETMEGLASDDETQVSIRFNNEPEVHMPTVREMREARHRMVVAATGKATKIDQYAEGYTCDIRDLLSDENMRLQASEGVWLRWIYPDDNKTRSLPVAHLEIEVRGCPYHLGGRDWPRRMYNLAIVHTADSGGLFEGEAHDRRMKQTPERVLLNVPDEDEDDGPPETEDGAEAEEGSLFTEGEEGNEQ